MDAIQYVQQLIACHRLILGDYCYYCCYAMEAILLHPHSHTFTSFFFTLLRPYFGRSGIEFRNGAHITFNEVIKQGWRPMRFCAHNFTILCFRLAGYLNATMKSGSELSFQTYSVCKQNVERALAHQHHLIRPMRSNINKQNVSPPRDIFSIFDYIIATSPAFRQPILSQCSREKWRRERGPCDGIIRTRTSHDCRTLFMKVYFGNRTSAEHIE